MNRNLTIKTKPGRTPGEFVVTLPPGWDLRMRRILKELMADSFPDPHEPGLSAQQREARIRLRQKRMRDAMCRFVSELIMADVVGKEVALSSRNHYGRRIGSLREHVAAILRDASSG